MPYSKKDFADSIKREIRTLGIEEYHEDSKKIINLYLKMFENQFGKEEVNEYIKNSELINLGWKAE